MPPESVESKSLIDLSCRVNETILLGEECFDCCCCSLKESVRKRIRQQHQVGIGMQTVLMSKSVRPESISQIQMPVVEDFG